MILLRNGQKLHAAMRNSNEPRIRIILREEEAEGAISNVKAKAILNGGLAKTEGRRILFGLHRLTIKLDNGMIVDTRSTVFHVVSHTP